jgi:hypothetical protein
MSDNKLTPKQKKFCDEYLVDFNVYNALNKTKRKVKTSDAINYYVYFLVEKSSGNIFYVGKGKGNRMKAHVREYKKTNGNNIKNKKIRDIIESHDTVESIIFEDNLTESNAFKIERVFIRTFEGLTNIMGGSHSKDESTLNNAQIILKNMIKPCELFFKTNERSIPIETTFKIYVQNIKTLKGIINELNTKIYGSA